jgi:hypothetical protein
MPPSGAQGGLIISHLLAAFCCCGNRSHDYTSGFSIVLSLAASVAQLAEQLICNQQVVGSSPSAGSSLPRHRDVQITLDSQPEGSDLSWWCEVV